ncbi:MAG: glycosyltransferase, partial [Verrucomicrobiota bacterium]
MKILVLSNLYPPLYVGGYELHCQIVVEGLRARGHIVQVLTSDFDVARQWIPLVETNVQRSLKIHGMFGHPWLGIHELEKQEQNNNETLRAEIEKFSPDLVYVWNMGGLSKSMLFTVQRLNIPMDFCVCDHWIARSADGDVWLSWWNRTNASLKHRALRLLWSLNGHRKHSNIIAPTHSTSRLRFPRIHFCSRFLRDFTADAGFDVSHGAVIYCPIRTQLFSGKPRTSAEPMTRLLYAGRLHPDKGVMTALKSLELLRHKFTGQLTLCGRGEPDYETELKNFVSERKLPVEFMSVSNPDEMAAVYRSHHALLFPSEWPEPFG